MFILGYKMININLSTVLNTFHFNKIIFRNYATVKRFYKNTGVLQSDGKFEITLDQKKLKTPKGNLFTLESEPLAYAVAAEWNSQNEQITRSKMHLTTLCNTVIDNPNNLTKYDIVNYITNYLDTDTVLFQANENEELLKFQEKNWNPVIEWFNKRYGLKIKTSQRMDVPPTSPEDRMLLSKYLMSYNSSAINGVLYGVDTLKSVILTLACTERFLTPESAVALSNLEEEFQSANWGRVEWAHDLNQQDLQSRLSAAVLFIYCNTNFAQSKKKV